MGGTPSPCPRLRGLGSRRSMQARPHCYQVCVMTDHRSPLHGPGTRSTLSVVPRSMHGAEEVQPRTAREPRIVRATDLGRPAVDFSDRAVATIPEDPDGRRPSLADRRSPPQAAARTAGQRRPVMGSGFDVTACFILHRRGNDMRTFPRKLRFWTAVDADAQLKLASMSDRTWP